MHDWQIYTSTPVMRVSYEASWLGAGVTSVVALVTYTTVTQMRKVKPEMRRMVGTK